MKVATCDICEFPAGYLTHDRYSGKMVCSECRTRIELAEDYMPTVYTFGRTKHKTY